MGCCQAGIQELELAFGKEANPSKNSVFSLNAQMGDDKEDIVITEANLFCDDRDEVVTFRTHRNDIDPFNREELEEAARSVSAHAIFKLMERKKEEKRMQKLKTIKFDTASIIQSAFLSKITKEK
ncbi:unnamed protein product [Blepharisma stoltei]|uniref:Uncharacterized protein n=1 Tax=Blepharisma stoltei TaxID=1481888 RepID=A0AAU9JCD5_9CILI|nr:unnamed protein product [Blepharisma stoltei]